MIGRRLAVSLGLALLVLGPASPVALAASTDPAVIATIDGNTSTVTIGTLESPSCVAYSGNSSPALYGGNGVEPVQQLPANSWSLATVLSCGFGLVPSTITGGVSVVKPSGIDEQPLTAAQLSPGAYPDPTEAPVISYDGEHVTYTRPWLGGSDENAPDSFQEPDGPVAIEVYKVGILSVMVTASNSNPTAGDTVTFQAAVTGSGAATLAYSWSTNGGPQTSTSASPAMSFPDAGVYNVTVQVTDGAGKGGSGSTTVTVKAAPGTPQTTTPTTPNPQPVGPANSNGTISGVRPGKAKPKQSVTPAKSGDTKHAATPTHKPSHQATKRIVTPAPAPSPTGAASSGSGTVGGTTGGPHTTAPTSTSAAHLPAPVKGRPKPGDTILQGQVVDGRLISGVAPLPLDASPLVSVVAASPAAAAPSVRHTSRTSILPGLGAVLAIILLLVLGAWHQLGWRRHPLARLAIG